MSLPAGRRAAWSIVDQGLSSLTNLALNVLVARIVAPDEFGAFAAAYMGYLLLVTAARAAGSEPLMVLYSAGTATAREEAGRRATGFALGLGLATGAACLIAGGLLGGSISGVLLALGITLPGLLLQDAFRFFLIADGRPERAAMSDGVWLVSQAITSAALLLTTDPTMGAVTLAWGVSGSLAALAAMSRAKCRPSIGHPFAWPIENRRLATGFLADHAMLIGTAHASFYLVGAISGLPALGALRAASVLLGPLTTFLHGIRLIAIPEGAREGAGAPANRRSVAVRASSAGAAAAMLFTIGLLFVPTSVGELLLGESWPGAREVAPWLGLATVFVGANTGALTGLRVLEDTARIVKGRLFVATLGLVASGSGAVVADAYGAAVATAGTNALSTGLWWRLYLSAVGERLQTIDGPAPSTDPRARNST